MDMEKLFQAPPYSLSQGEKEDLYAILLSSLTEHHRENCPEYGKLLEVLGVPSRERCPLENIPLLPGSLFKTLSLQSIPEEAVFKTLVSSGTTGQRPAKIVLDQETCRLQQQALCHILTDFVGKRRLPMLVLDTKAVLRDRDLFSARGAGILGFSLAASRVYYALDENMNLDEGAVEEFLSRCGDDPGVLFGFTYILWKHIVQVLEEQRRTLPLSKGILLHGGGWKKLSQAEVSPQVFRQRVQATTGISRIHSYYGMVEQTGSIFMECQQGHLHASVFSDVLIRSGRDNTICPIGQEGIVQVLTPLARSYPGHSILTEDRGVLLGTDDCPCGRKGKYFRVLGRIPEAEIRGCSDTYDG